VPGEYRAEAILEGLKGENLTGQRFLMPRAMVAREVLPDTLGKWGAQVDVVPAYQTVLPAERSSHVLELLRKGAIHCVSFTSSSTVSNFFSLFDKSELLPLLEHVTIASIGPITTETAEKFGLKVSIMPSDYTIPALVDAICTYFRGRQSASKK